MLERVVLTISLATCEQLLVGFIRRSTLYFFKVITVNFLNVKINVLTLIGTFMFIGAIGKSAQLILHSVDKILVLVKILA